MVEKKRQQQLYLHTRQTIHNRVRKGITLYKQDPTSSGGTTYFIEYEVTTLQALRRPGGWRKYARRRFSPAKLGL